MWYNSLVTGLLHSPLHGLVDSNVTQISFRGQRSGTAYTVPVNYVRIGDELWIVSLRTRTWWRNLRDGASVKVCLQGKETPAIAVAIEDVNAVTEDLATLSLQAPQFTRYLNIHLDSHGAPNQTGLTRAASTHVIVRVKLGDEARPADRPLCPLS